MVDTFSKVRTRLLLDNPFFGTLAMQWNVTADTSIETMSTNGPNLRYNPAFLDSLSGPQQKGLVAHEVLHCALLHMYRRGSRDPMGWNVACDHVVNLMLKASGFELPSGGMEDPQFAGMSAEQVYSKIQQDQAKQDQPGKGNNGQGKAQGPGTGQQSGQGQGTAPGTSNGGTNPVLSGCKTGDFTDGPKQGEEQSGQLSETGWQIAVEQALRVASMAGTVPAGMQVAVDGTRAPRVDWIAELRDFITHTVPNNYSWSTPARRFISQGLYLPGVQNENLGTIVVAVDSSGSTTPFLENFTSEFRGILREARPERVVLIYCDAAIQSATEMLPDDFDTKLTIKGGGGTKFSPVFTHVEKEGIEPVALIYLTDLDNSDQVTEPGYPVLWCTPECVSKQAPFGRTVRIQEVK